MLKKFNLLRAAGEKSFFNFLVSRGGGGGGGEEKSTETHQPISESISREPRITSSHKGTSEDS